MRSKTLNVNADHRQKKLVDRVENLIIHIKNRWTFCWNRKLHIDRLRISSFDWKRALLDIFLDQLAWLNDNHLILSSNLMYKTMFVSFILFTIFIKSLCLFWFCKFSLILVLSSNQIINFFLKRQRAFTTCLVQSNMCFSEISHMIAMSKNSLTLSSWSSR
jgi:hypothetical protein